jgi:hypothetical protein
MYRISVLYKMFAIIPFVLCSVLCPVHVVFSVVFIVNNLVKVRLIYYSQWFSASVLILETCLR